jgi:hypothetical protein
MLGSLGYDRELASDGLESLGKLAGEIELVLLVVMTPGLDGFEVTRRIRADGKITESHTLLGAGLLAGPVRANPGGLNDRLDPLRVVAPATRADWRAHSKTSNSSGSNWQLRPICAVVDVFDALTSDRPYRQTFPLAQVLELMRTVPPRGCRPETIQDRDDIRASLAPLAY